MRTFDVTCYAPNGSLAWGMTQEAESPALAIAQAVLPPDQREAFAAARMFNADSMTVDHPLSPGYKIVAEAW